jgi:hypothetical protein
MALSDKAYTLAEGLGGLLAQPVLTVAREDLTGRDLVAAGVVSGRWLQLEADLLAGLALSASQPADKAEVDAALREFRYARRLTSGQDFRRWLDERGLALRAVRAALERELLRERAESEPPAGAPDRERAVAALHAEAVCSGALTECGWWLADRLLVAGDGDAGDPGDPRVRELVATEGALLAVAGLEEPEEARAERLARILAADAAFDAHAAAIGSDEAVAACADAHRLEWLGFELDGLRCTTASVAAEAALMLRDDALPMSEVASAACLEEQSSTLLLQDAPAPLRTALSGAAPGDVIGPVEVDGAYEVWHVGRRRPPDPHDPLVHDRALAEVIAADTGRRRAGRIRWHERA